MNKNLLTFISHNFCVNCCGDEKKLDCDSRGVTCNKLTNFLVGCNLYKTSIDEEKLGELAEEFANKYSILYTQQYFDLQCGFQAGYRKALEHEHQ